MAGFTRYVWPRIDAASTGGNGYFLVKRLDGSSYFFLPFALLAPVVSLIFSPAGAAAAAPSSFLPEMPGSAC